MHVNYIAYVFELFIILYSGDLRDISFCIQYLTFF